MSDPPSANALYICDTNNYEELTQCQGLDDETTCANLLDADGNVATCIQSSCGFKLFDKLDVSVAGSSDPYSADGANDPTSFLSVMSIFYGVAPYLLGFIYVTTFLITGSIVPLTRLIVFGAIAVINETVFKNIVAQKRPIGSCLHFKSFGMPSGHSATSIGLLTYILLEVFVLHPNLICGLTCQKGDGDGETVYNFTKGYGWQKKEESTYHAADVETGGHTFNSKHDSDASVFPIALKPLQRKWTYHVYALLYFLLLFPVPFSRVYLYDHFMKQVLLGSAEGIVIASFWYLIVMRLLGMRLIKWWSKSSCANWFGLKF